MLQVVGQVAELPGQTGVCPMTRLFWHGILSQSQAACEGG